MTKMIKLPVSVAIGKLTIGVNPDRIEELAPIDGMARTTMRLSSGQTRVVLLPFNEVCEVIRRETSDEVKIDLDGIDETMSELDLSTFAVTGRVEAAMREATNEVAKNISNSFRGKGGAFKSTRTATETLIRGHEQQIRLANVLEEFGRGCAEAGPRRANRDVGSGNPSDCTECLEGVVETITNIFTEDGQ